MHKQVLIFNLPINSPTISFFSISMILDLIVIEYNNGHDLHQSLASANDIQKCINATQFRIARQLFLLFLYFVRVNIDRGYY